MFMKQIAKAMILAAFVLIAEVVCGAQVAIPQGLSATTNLNTGITLTWTRVAGASSYIVYRYGGMSSQTGLFTTNVTTTTFLDTTAPVMQPVPYRVRAVGADGSVSDYSAYVRGQREILLRGRTGARTCVVPSAGSVQNLSMPIECNYAWTVTADAWIEPYTLKYKGCTGYTNVLFSVAANSSGLPRVGKIIASSLHLSITNYVVQGAASETAATPVQALDNKRLEGLLSSVEGLVAESAAFVPYDYASCQNGACLRSSPMKAGDRCVLKCTPKRPCRLSFRWWTQGNVGTLTLREGEDPATATVLKTCRESSYFGITCQVELTGNARPIWIVYETGEGAGENCAAFLDAFKHEYEPKSLRFEGMPPVPVGGSSTTISANDVLPVRTIATYWDDSEEEVDATLTCSVGGGVQWDNVRMADGRRGVVFTQVGTSQTATLRASLFEYGKEVTCSRTLKVVKSLNEALDDEVLDFVANGAWVWSDYGAVAKSGVSGSAARCLPTAHGGVSTLRTTVNGSTQLDFRWAVVSEKDHDWLRLVVDGEQVAALTGNCSSFSSHTMRILGAGEHEIRWEFVKDDSGSVADEGAWLDDVQFCTIPDVPQNFRLSEDVYPDMVRLVWDPAENADGYIVCLRDVTDDEWNWVELVEGRDNHFCDFDFTKRLMRGHFVMCVAAVGGGSGEPMMSDMSNEVEITPPSVLVIESPNSMFVYTSNAQRGGVAVQSSYPYWTASADVDWIHFFDEDLNLADSFLSEEVYSPLRYTIDENATGKPRMGTITVRAPEGAFERKITILQSSGDAELNEWDCTIDGPSVVNTRETADYSLRLVIDGESIVNVTNVEWTVESPNNRGIRIPAYIYNRVDGDQGVPGRLFVEDIDQSSSIQVKATLEVNGMVLRPTKFVTVHPRPSVLLPTGLDPLLSEESFRWHAAMWEGQKILRTPDTILDFLTGCDLRAQVTGPGILRFDWMIPTAASVYATRFSLLLDDVTAIDYTGQPGEFSEQCLVIPEGSHEICWSYFRSQPYMHEDGYGVLRNLRWDVAVDTGNLRLTGPTNIVPGSAAGVVKFCRIYEVASEEQLIDVPIAVTNAAAWTVDFGESRTAEAVTWAVSPGGALTISVPLTVDWADEATVSCRVEVDGVVQERIKVIAITPIPLSQVLDCAALFFRTWKPGDYNNGAAWEISSDDCRVGEYSMRASGQSNSYWSENSFPQVQTFVFGAGEVSFDWRLFNGETAIGERDSGLRVYVDGSEVWRDAWQGQGADGWETATVQVDGEGMHAVTWCYDGGTNPENEAFLDHVVWTPSDPDDQPTPVGIRLVGPTEVTGRTFIEYTCLLQLKYPDGTVAEQPWGYSPDAWSFVPVSGDLDDWTGNTKSSERWLYLYPGKDEISTPGSFEVGVSLTLAGHTFTDSILVEYGASTTLDRALADVPFRDNMAFRYGDNWYGSYEGAHAGPTCGRMCPLESTEQDSGCTLSSVGFEVYGHGNFTFDCTTDLGVDHGTLVVVVDDEMDNPALVLEGVNGWQRYTIAIPEPEDGIEVNHTVWIYVVGGDEGMALDDSMAIDDVQWDGEVALPIEDWAWSGPDVMTNGLSRVVGLKFFRQNLKGGGEEEEGDSSMPAEGDDVPQVSYTFTWPDDLVGKVQVVEGPNANEVTVTTPSTVSVGGVVTVTATFTLWEEEFEENFTFEVFALKELRRSLDNPDLVYELGFVPSEDEDDRDWEYGESMIERLDLPNLWFGVTAEGATNGSAARSGRISHGESTSLSATLLGPGTLTFDWRVSSESGWDKLVVMANGRPLDEISGETAWETKNYTLTDATNVVTWTYSKDGSASAHQDCAWVDNIRWTGSYLPAPPLPDEPTATETSRGVPYAWLQSYGIPPQDDSWESTQELRAANGKNSMRECYIAGLDPTDAASEFKALISITNGVTYVTWVPDLTPAREYIIKGKVNLDDPAWVAPTNSTHRFFKVEIKWDK